VELGLGIYWMCGALDPLPLPPVLSLARLLAFRVYMCGIMMRGISPGDVAKFSYLVCIYSTTVPMGFWRVTEDMCREFFFAAQVFIKFISNRVLI